MSASSTTPPPEMISNYHVDLWEHASKLYHLFHWQQAEDIFSFLAKDIAGARQRTLCLLNKSMVEARLGDYNKAALTIADAAELGEDLPISAFLAGLINWDLSQLPLAEAWFEACLTGIDERGFDCREDGLNFVLELAEVQHNLEVVSQTRLAQELGLEDAAPDELYYLPAEILFEAPPRSSGHSPTGGPPVLPFENEADTGPTQSSSVAQTAVHERSEVLSRVPSSSYSVASVGESLSPLICEEILGSPCKMFFERSVPLSPATTRGPKPNHQPIVINSSVALSSPAQPSPDSTAKELRSLERIRQREAAVHADGRASPTVPRTKIPYTWHGQQRLRYEPRDARGLSDSVKELAHSVQKFAPEGSYPVRKIMTPDARLKEALEAGQSPSTEASIEEYDKLAMRLGVIPDTADLHDMTEQRKRAATFEEQFERPSLDRAVARPVRTSSLLHAIHPLRLGSPTKGHHKRNKVRWPFQDDPEEEIKPETPQPATSADPATGLKPVPFDFIMGPDGKTIVIEKAPKAVLTVSQALKQVQEARRHGARERESEMQDPVSPAPAPPGNIPARKPVASQSSEPLPILQPSVYRPPSWRKLKIPNASALISPSPTTKPVRPSISAPFDPRHLSHLDEHSLAPPPLNISKRDPTAQSPLPSPEAATPSPRSGSRYVPSGVSSINMWDYLLDKLKPDEPKGKGKK